MNHHPTYEGPPSSSPQFPQIWLIVTSNEDKFNVGQTFGRSNYAVEVFSVADVTSELEKLERAGA